MSILFVTTLISYTMSIGLVFFTVKNIKSRDKKEAESRFKTESICRFSLLASIVLHAGLLYMTNHYDGEFNLSLGRAISLSAWMSMALYLVFSLFTKTLSLGIIIAPIGMFGFLAGYMTPGSPFLISELSTGQSLPGMILHIVIAVPAYGVLCIAFAQAMVLFFQEKQLHRPNPVSHLKFLPAIETMESNLFWLTYMGFILLTVNLIMGGYLSWHYYGQVLWINHHILLSLLSWFCFGFLLLGRNLFGWRGEHAAKWTMGGFAFLALGYFGTRFVRDIILA
ncbi:MAG: hypothetical protein GKR95_07190 [Gammaproteobacteria bacterium]|nr:hypothetical protein [Gammaproteobacteria bacterium]